MASSSRRHPLLVIGGVLVGAVGLAGSLVAVLGFFGVTSWPEARPTTTVASAGPVTPQPPTTVPVTDPVTTPPPTRPAPAPTTTCACESGPPPPPAASVRCVIEDDIAFNQRLETVRIGFGSKTWDLQVDSTHQTAQVTLTFPRAGNYRYTLTSVTDTYDGRTIRGAGGGTMTCLGGETFQVTADESTDPVQLSLR